MIPSRRSLALAALVAALGAAPPQTLSDLQLQRFTVQYRFPAWCGSAQFAANELRVNPTTDPARLRAAAAAFRSCAESPPGIHHAEVRNLADFTASAALLLAARHADGAGRAAADATTARDLSQAVIDYVHQPVVGTATGYTPSPLITDAGRVNRDATALAGSAPPSP